MFEWLDKETAVNMVTAIAAVATLLSGLREYKRANTWKRREFVATVVDRLKSDPSANNALLMLDWNQRKLWFCDGSETRRAVVVDDRMIGRALIPHDLAGRPVWGEDEVAIRDSFDEMLGHLEHIDTMIEAGLIRLDEIKPYLAYWMKLMCDRAARGGPTTLRHAAIRNLWIYINHYGFERVVRLADRFGYAISVRTPGSTGRTGEEWAALEAECLLGNVWHSKVAYAAKEEDDVLPGR